MRQDRRSLLVEVTREEVFRRREETHRGASRVVVSTLAMSFTCALKFISSHLFLKPHRPILLIK